MRVMRVAKALLPVSGIPAVHLLAVSGNYHIIPLVMMIVVCLYAVLAALSGAGWKSFLFMGGILALLAGLQVLVFQGDASFARAVFMTPVLIQGWLTWVFARTLLPGREPLLRRISRLHRDPFPPELESYTRYLTAFWSVLLALTTIVSVVSGLAADPATWSWLVNIGAPAFLFAVFLMEHGYRAIVFRRFGGNSPLTTLKVIARPESWMLP